MDVLKELNRLMVQARRSEREDLIDPRSASEQIAFLRRVLIVGLPGERRRSMPPLPRKERVYHYPPVTLYGRTVELPHQAACVAIMLAEVPELPTSAEMISRRMFGEPGRNVMDIVGRLESHLRRQNCGLSVLRTMEGYALVVDEQRRQAS